MFTDAALTRDPPRPGAVVDLAWNVGDTWTSDPYAVLIDGDPVDLAVGWTVRGYVAGADAPRCEWTSTEDGGGTVVIGRADVELADGTVVPTSTVRLTHTAAQSSAAGAFYRVRMRVQVIAEDGTTYTVLDGRATAWTAGVRW